MTNTEQNNGKAETSDKILQLTARMKETWSKLSDDDIKLYNGNRDQFFAKLKEKHNVSKEDAIKRMQEIEKTIAPPADKATGTKVA